MERVNRVISPPVCWVETGSMRARWVSTVAEVLWRVPRGNDEGLPGEEGDGAAVGGRAADGEGAGEDEEELVFVVVGVPGELAEDAGYLEKVIVDLGDDAGGPEIGEGGGGFKEGDGGGREVGHGGGARRIKEREAGPLRGLRARQAAGVAGKDANGKHIPCGDDNERATGTTTGEARG